MITFLATSLKNDTVHCWIIDKTIASEELGYDNNSIVILSNVKEVDLADFGEIFSSSHIKMKSKTEYRRELNYE